MWEVFELRKTKFEGQINEKNKIEEEESTHGLEELNLGHFVHGTQVWHACESTLGSCESTLLEKQKAKLLE